VIHNRTILVITILGATHPVWRERNEDCFYADSSMGFGLVGDGMGGYACGELASDWVKATVEKAVANHEDSRVAITSAHTVLKILLPRTPLNKLPVIAPEIIPSSVMREAKMCNGRAK
jgi:serine/threonine protein phosphatase PrpC